MSLCLILLSEKEAYIGADSRVCATLDHNPDSEGYHMHDNAVKLHNIGNHIIFTSGVKYVCDNTLELFRESENKSIGTLQRIMKLVGEDLKNNYPVYLPEGFIEFTIISSHNNKITLYSIGNLDNYKIMSFPAQPNRLIPCLAGFHNGVMSYVKPLLGQMPVIDLYSKVYRHFASEKIGGNLTLYRMCQNGVQLIHNAKIKDSRKLKSYEDNRHLLHYILGQRVSIGDADGVMLTEGPKTTITDRNNRLAMSLGLVETNPDLFGININRYSEVTPDSTEIINKISVTSKHGFKIEKKVGNFYENVAWLDNDGTLKIKGHFQAGDGNNVFKVDDNGAYLGHAVFEQAPFRVTPSGAVTASNITVTGGQFNIGGKFSVDRNGIMSATGANFSGTISASIINGGSISGTYIDGVIVNGSTFQTAPSGQRLVADNNGLRVYDDSGKMRFAIHTFGGLGYQPLLFFDQNENQVGTILNVSNRFIVTAMNGADFYLGGTASTTYFDSSTIDFQNNSVLNFPVSNVKGLQTLLNDMHNKISILEAELSKRG